jgi:hypothetical protein
MIVVRRNDGLFSNSKKYWMRDISAKNLSNYNEKYHYSVHTLLIRQIRTIKK